MTTRRVLFVEPLAHVTPGHVAAETYSILTAVGGEFADWSIDVLSHRGFPGELDIERKCPRVRFFQAVPRADAAAGPPARAGAGEEATADYLKDLAVAYAQTLRSAAQFNRAAGYSRVVVLDGFNARALDLGAEHYRDMARMGTRVFIKVVNWFRFLGDLSALPEQGRRVCLAQRQAFSDIAHNPAVTFFFYSEAIRRLYLKLGLPERKAVFCPVGVDGGEADGGNGDGAGRFAAGEPRLLFFGTLRPEKGINVLLEAIALNPPGPRYVIAGKQRAWDRVERLDRYFSTPWEPTVAVRNESVAEDDKDRLYRDADFILMPYRSGHLESSALFYDTARHRKPFIASALGDRAEHIRGYNMGYLCEPDDAESLAAAVRRAVACTEEQYRAMQDGVARFARENSWPEVVRRHWLPLMQ
jgi:glycosyltransferase involved in cell wall biosynthesis